MKQDTKKMLYMILGAILGAVAVLFIPTFLK